MSTSEEADRVVAPTTPITDAKSVPRAFARLATVLFPFLPLPARIAAGVLAAAMILATALAWLGALGGAGISSGLRPVPLFAAVVLTGATIAAAALPRYTYNWLEKRNWFTNETFTGIDVVFPVLGAHVIGISLEAALLNLSEGHPSSHIMASVSVVGAVLWGVHEALRAYRVHQN